MRLSGGNQCGPQGDFKNGLRESKEMRLAWVFLVFVVLVVVCFLVVRGLGQGEGLGNFEFPISIKRGSISALLPVVPDVGQMGKKE